MGKNKEYSTDELTVIWKPDLCIHSGNCVMGLPEVFRPKEKPWVKVDAASSDALISQIKKCPSGALSLRMEDETSHESTPS